MMRFAFLLTILFGLLYLPTGCETGDLTESLATQCTALVETEEQVTCLNEVTTELHSRIAGVRTEALESATDPTQSDEVRDRTDLADETLEDIRSCTEGRLRANETDRPERGRHLLNGIGAMERVWDSTRDSVDERQRREGEDWGDRDDEDEDGDREDGEDDEDEDGDREDRDDEDEWDWRDRGDYEDCEDDREDWEEGEDEDEERP